MKRGYIFGILFLLAIFASISFVITQNESGNSYCNDDECMLYEGDRTSYKDYIFTLDYIDADDVTLNIEGFGQYELNVGKRITITEDLEIEVEQITKIEDTGTRGFILFDITKKPSSERVDAYELDQKYDFYTAGKLYDDWSNKYDEKWVQSGTLDGAWVFILPSGEVYLWDEDSGKSILKTSDPIATVEKRYFQNPRLLIDVKDPNEGSGGGDEMVTYQGVLDMLSSCTLARSSKRQGSFESCNDLCSQSLKSCLVSLVSDIKTLSDGRISSDQKLTSCSDSIVTGNYNIDNESTADLSLTCICCGTN